MNVLITGAAGRVGSRLLRYFSDCGLCDRVYGLYRGHLEPEQALRMSLPGNVEPVRHDLARRLERPDIRADVVIHSAAIRPAARCEGNYEDAIASNILGTKNIVEFARKSGVKHFIFLSVQSVYGQCPPPHREDHPVSGSNLHDITKIAGEMIVAAGLGGPIRYHILRLAHIYGFADQVDGVLKAFRDSVRRGVLPIHGSGEQTCCFLHILDLCALVAHLVQSPPAAGIYNVCSETITVKQLAAHFAAAHLERGGQDVQLMHLDHENASNYGLDTSKIMAATGWHPAHTVGDFVNNLFSCVSGNRPGRRRSPRPRRPAATPGRW